jgi:hypothetical protein
MFTVKLAGLGLLIIASMSAAAPCLAESMNGQFAPQNDVPVNAWADVQQNVQQMPNVVAQAVMPAFNHVVYRTAPSYKKLAPKTSKRSNTNLSATLPPTVTFENMTDLGVVDDGSFEPKIDVAGMIDSYYENSRLINERIEASKEERLPGQ